MTSSQADDHAKTQPSPWIERFAALVRSGSRVLDVACGPGRHSRFFAARGCRVLAVDRDVSALATLDDVGGVTTLCADLEGDAWPLPDERFDAIVVTNYPHRPLFPHLLDAVADDGVLLYATFAAGNEVYGKPSNPAFLLRPDELMTVIGGRLDVVAFEQGVTRGERPAVIQRIAAVGHACPWPRMLPPDAGGSRRTARRPGRIGTLSRIG